MKQDTIPIFFTVDESYAPYLDCAIRSMMENASGAHTYQIIVLHEDLTEESQRKLSANVKPPFRIRFLSMKDKLAGITDRAENRLRCDYFTLTIYFRLFIADLFPEYDKGIYLDSDIVVPGDISRLFRTELGDNIIAACADPLHYAGARAGGICGAGGGNSHRAVYQFRHFGDESEKNAGGGLLQPLPPSAEHLSL